MAAVNNGELYMVLTCDTTSLVQICQDLESPAMQWSSVNMALVNFAHHPNTQSSHARQAHAVSVDVSGTWQ